MEDNRIKVIANFHISLICKDSSRSCYSITRKLWSDENGKVTEDVVDKWENDIRESVLKEDYTVCRCGVLCTSFFKLDNK